MSVAFEVKDVTADTSFELQHFPSGLFESDEQVAQFANALEAWCTVSTPTVVSVREILMIDDRDLVLITDLPKGEPLRERLKTHNLWSPKEAVGLARELLGGLATLHERGLVHGDIKPNSIFVEGEGLELNAQMIDGGVTTGLWMAKDLGDKTALIGTPYYAPAEQFGGDSPNVQSDLYNVAAVLFELIAGSLPWTGRNFLEVFQAKIAPTVASLRQVARDVEISDALESAVTKGVQADPHNRFKSATDFLAALEGATK
ncbi:MAG: serine/threonine protein kinase [Planctomycetota bacterium]|jgi:serine/threonine protein kinase